MTNIKATDEIIVPFQPEAVWRLLSDVRGYPRWWPPALGLRVLSAGEEPVGAEVEVRPAGGEAFRCRVAATDVPSRMQMQYFGGFVEGTGEWRLEPSGAGTRITYSIDAQARGMLVALLSRTMDLGALHSRQMREVLENLARALQEQDRGGPSRL
jgi:ribosome-associated toxin RatA of RatAB toxin-antitoxin module